MTEEKITETLRKELGNEAYEAELQKIYLKLQDFTKEPDEVMQNPMYVKGFCNGMDWITQKDLSVLGKYEKLHIKYGSLLSVVSYKVIDFFKKKNHD